MSSEDEKNVAREVLKQKLQEFKTLCAKQKIKSEKRLWNYVYLVRCEKYHKIGYAHNVESRFNNFKGANPFEVEMIYCVKVPNAKQTESELHKKYHHKRHRREWFILEEEDIKEIKELLKEYA